MMPVLDSAADDLSRVIVSPAERDRVNVAVSEILDRRDHREQMRDIVEQADAEALEAFSKMATRAGEIQRIEAAKDKQRTLLQFATSRMAWADARQAIERLEELDGELADVRKR